MPAPPALASSRFAGNTGPSWRSSTSPYQELRWRGVKPADWIRCSTVWTEERWKQPAAETTFSSSIVPPKSFAPNCRLIWPIFMPWVT